MQSRKKSVYLSGPIDLVTKEEARSWRVAAGNELRHLANIIDPTDYFMDWDIDPSDEKVAEVIVAFDKHKLRQADVVLVDANTPGWGTAMEVFLAHESGVPVVAWLAKDKVHSTWLVHHTYSIRTSLNECIDVVKEILHVCDYARDRD